MKIALPRKLVRYAAVGALGAFALVGTACLPRGVTLVPTGGSAATCPAGTWHLASETVTGSLETLLGNATITTSGSGLTLKINTGTTSTWSLTGNQNIHITSTNINATASVNPAASGTDTITGSNITFTLKSVSGTVAASGTAFGHAFSINWPLGNSGAIKNLYGLSGTATFSCTNGTLTLSLPTVHMGFKH
jgi:hypothetical protein